jgi:hypothetical protein
MTISREEFNTAMSGLHEKMNGISISVAEIKTEMRLKPIPKIPPRPCEQLQEHLNDHKESRLTWSKAFIGAIASSVVSAVVAALTTAWVFLRNK